MAEGRGVHLGSMPWNSCASCVLPGGSACERSNHLHGFHLVGVAHSWSVTTL